MAALSSFARDTGIASNDDWGMSKDNVPKPWYSLGVSSGLKQWRSSRITPASAVDTDCCHSPVQPQANPCCQVSFNSPCIVAGSMLKGRIHFTASTDYCFDAMRTLQVEMIGIEEVIDNTQATKVHSRVFFQQDVEDREYIENPQHGLPYVSFRTTLPTWLGGTYIDLHSRVYYVIQGIMPSEFGDGGANRILEKEVVVRAKADQLTEKDRELYTLVSAHNSISSSRYGGDHVTAKLSLQRRIWTSGSTIFCALHISNDTNTLINDANVVLLRRQNTYSQSNQSFRLMSVQSFSEVINSSSITSLGYLQGIATGQCEDFILGLNTSATDLTVKSQMLVDVSYAIQASITSILGEELMVEIPITLVHPESVEPPVHAQPYQQMVTRSTFSDLLNRTYGDYEDSECSSDSDTDEFETVEIMTPERDESIFQQRASFSIFNTNDPEPSATLRRTTLSCQELKQQVNISHKVTVVPVTNDIASTQEAKIERTTGQTDERVSAKIYNVRKATVEDVAINIIEPNSSGPGSLALSKQGNPRLNARHRLQSFRNNFRV